MREPLLVSVSSSTQLAAVGPRDREAPGAVRSAETATYERIVIADNAGRHAIATTLSAPEQGLGLLDRPPRRGCGSVRNS
jgi:hypothetical protein